MQLSLNRCHGWFNAPNAAGAVYDRARSLHRDIVRGHRPRLQWISVALIATLLFACSSKPAETEEETEHVVTVDVAPVLSGPISQKITANALLYPLEQASITPKISAPVKTFYVNRGSPVRAGQLVAELENRDLAGAVAEARAAYEQAQANYEIVARGTASEDAQKAELDVQSTKAALDAQQKLFDSRQELYRQGAISQKEVNDAQVALTQAKAQYDAAVKHLQTLKGVSGEQQIKAAAAQRDAAKARLDTAEAQLSYSRITSPINGVVADRPLYPGEMAQSGSPLMTIMDLSQVIARAHVPQEDAKLLKIGDAATLQPANGTAPAAGRVTLISPALDPSSTTVEVWVQAANPNNRLKPGTSLRVEMIARTIEDALTIPAAAVITGPSGATSAMVVDSDNKPHKQSITTGIRDADRVQVTEGLQSGERVVTAGSFELAKLDADVLGKTKVQIQAPKEEDDEDDK